MKIILIIFTLYSYRLAFTQFNARSLAMGGTSISHGAVRDALFDNPARLSDVNEFELLIVDLNIGTNGYQLYDKYTGLENPDDFSQALRELYGEHLWFGAMARTQITMPYFSLAYYDKASINLSIDNPVVPEMYINGYNDYGFAAAFSFILVENLSVGTTLRRVERRGASQVFGPSYINQLNPELIIDNIDRVGIGYGLDLGVDYKLSGMLNPKVSFVWSDIGNTSFKPYSGVSAPPSEESRMSLGLSMQYDSTMLSLTPALEFKDISNTDMDITKKIYLGIEADFPIFDIRAGYSQGYLTYGFGVDVGFVNLEAASYGVELGEYAGQREDRRYVIQLSVDLGFDLDFNFLSSSERSKKSRNLKQRR